MAKPGRPRKVVVNQKIDIQEACDKCKDKVCISKEAIDDCRISKNELLKELADRDIEIEKLTEKHKGFVKDIDTFKSKYLDLLRTHENVVEKNAYLLNKIDDLKASLILWFILALVSTITAFIVSFYL